MPERHFLRRLRSRTPRWDNRPCKQPEFSDIRRRSIYDSDTHSSRVYSTSVNKICRIQDRCCMRDRCPANLSPISESKKEYFPRSSLRYDLQSYCSCLPHFLSCQKRSLLRIEQWRIF